MQQRELVSGFSDLKDLLIRTYKIDRDRSLVMLYFTEADDQLLMHDYDDHNKVITICSNLKNKFIKRDVFTVRAIFVVENALDQDDPSVFLNSSFKLNGFFRS